MTKKICKGMIVFLAAAFLFLTTASIAPAQEGPLYVGIFGAFVMPQDIDTEDGGDIDTDDTWAVGAKVGYIIPQVKWLAAELEYSYFDKTDFDEPGIDGDWYANNLMANLLFRFPQGRIHPFAGGGIGMSRASVDFTEVGGASFDDDDTAFAYQLMAGVNFEITPNWSADLAYKYFNCEYELDGDIEIQSHIIQLGINYHF